MFGFQREEFFQADEEGRAEVRVDFSREREAAAPAPPAASEAAETQPEQPEQQ